MLISHIGIGKVTLRGVKSCHKNVLTKLLDIVHSSGVFFLHYLRCFSANAVSFLLMSRKCYPRLRPLD